MSGPAIAVTRPRAGTYAGLFMVTLSTLAYEIALTRIFSVTMLYHFAFVAISAALFGLTAGALIVYLRPDRFTPARVNRQLWLFSLLFAVALVVCLAAQLMVPFRPRLTAGDVAAIVFSVTIIAVPFVLSGVVVCLALTRFPDRVNRLYAADLVGAALGCLVLAVLLNSIDAPSAVIVIGALAAIGAVCFAATSDRRRVVIAGLVAVALAGFGALNVALQHGGDAPLRVRWIKEFRAPDHLYEKWNAFSRITVEGDPTVDLPPFGWAMSATIPEDMRVRQLRLFIDSGAGTVLTHYTGDPDETDFLRYDITNLAHYARRNADVFVIGTGGGRDVLSALEFGQRSVVAVDVNGDIIDTVNDRYGDFTGHLDRDPRVRFVTDEARSYLARNDRRYDIIQMSLIDTWSATSAGAFALTENSLYTTDAWTLFLDRLQPHGILTVSRFYGGKSLEIYRAVGIASKALKERGVANPRDHILVYHGPSHAPFPTTGTVLVSPQPFSDADRAQIGAAARQMEFTPVLTPDSAISSRFAALASRAGPDDAVSRFDEDVSPPSDNRPFFFQMVNLRSLFNGSAFDDTFVTRPVVVLSLFALAVLLLTARFIVAPLLLTRRRVQHRGMLPFYVYFGSIGLGFLFVEVSQLLRLSIYLGHPVLSLTVVLFTILLFSGIGSMLTERFVRPERGVSLVVPLVVLLVLLIVYGVITPSVLSGTDSATTPVRIAIAVALLMPLGFVMGMPLANGMRAASQRVDAPTAFLWGVNGATSVCASVFGLVIALFFGISFAFWAGWVAYAVATVAMGAVIVRRRRLPEPELDVTVDVEAPVGAAV